MNRFTEVYLVGVVSLGLLAGCAAYAAGILYTADGREAAALAATYAGHWRLGGGPMAGLAQLRLLLAGAALGLALLGGALARRRGQPAHYAWRAGWRLAEGRLAQGWRALLPRQRHLALGLLAALTGLRIAISRGLITFDDSASYDYFVRKSLLTVSADYPAPNNHVLSNTLSWLFYQVYPGYWWSMRVPVLLLSTLATAGWFLGLLRRSNFRVAGLALTFFSLLEASLFYAAEGRGYALLLVLSCAGFFSLLSLTDAAAEAPGPLAGWAWASLVAAGMLGLYTVPIFAYFLVAAYGWLGFCWRRVGARRRLLSAGLAGAATLLGAALLYVPLLLVSGPGALLQNTYVKPLSAAAFWQQLPTYVWGLEGELMGEEYKGFLASLHVGSLAAVAVLAGLVGLLVAARRGRLSAPTATYLRRLGEPVLWFIVLPYALMVAQHVLAPGRALLFKALCMFVLLGIEVDWLLRHFAARRRQLHAGLLLVGGLWAGVQLVQLYRSNRVRLTYFDASHAAARWLLAQPPGPVLSRGSSWNMAAIRFFVHLEKPAAPFDIDTAARRGVRYRYLIGPPAAGPAPSPAARPNLHIGPGAHNTAIDITARW